MSLFVDASALVAMIAGEPEQEAFAAQVRDDGDPLWSPMSCWETVSSLRRSYDFAFDDARNEVELVAEAGGFRLVPIGATELQVALEAFRRYGRGNHPAKLNFGDCFAYACAKTNSARLLYKGNDFARTDLA